MKRIESEAYREVQKLQGEADAKASEIYASAYGASAGAAEFYRFLRTMATYQKTFNRDSTLILSTDSDFFQYLKRTMPTNALGRP